MEMRNGSLKKIAFISSYPPRKCGIAVFTADLINNMSHIGGREFDPFVIAMQSGQELRCDDPVGLTIRKDVKQDYFYAADYINLSDVEVVSVQYEFGLFGGKGGSHLSYFLKRLDKPVVTTLHTVLDEPSSEYFDSLIDICAASQKVVVMNKRGIKMLNDIYGVPRKKIDLIPHGIPNLPFANSSYYKEKLGIGGRETILTFGLLSENKGIEVMLKALPRIVKSRPSIRYIILGATHPEVLSREGNSYKWRLQKMVEDLQLEGNVAFFNSFVEDEELFLFLGAADVYVTPYLHEKQLTSGTLAFAMGAGKAIVSTPYWAAQELLAKGRGKLVGFGDSDHMARAILEILGHDSSSFGMRVRAYQYGRSMTWPKVAQAYWKLFSSKIPSVPVPLRSSVDSKDWMIPAYEPQPVFQSA
jgi:glycosyltransferase involved in cell wall biosynthesis